MMTFSEKLVVLRKIKHLTQDEFASAVGVSRQAVYKWESGQSYPEVQKLLEMKLLFGISIDDLLDDTFEIELPKKKRKKRMTKEEKARLEAEANGTATEVKAEPAPAPVVKEEPKVEPAPVVKEEPKVEPAPVVKEEPKVEETPVVKEEPKAAPAPVVKPEPAVKPAPKKAEPVISEDDSAESLKKQVSQKGSLFERLFGNKK